MQVDPAPQHPQHLTPSGVCMYPGDLVEEPVPTEINASSLGHGVVVERDRLTVKYTGDARHNNDVGAVVANRPLPRKRLISYFEVTVINEGAKAKVAVGFSGKVFKLTRQPGWEPGSYGYHGDDGKKFHETGNGEDYGPRFGTGDVIGAGIHLGRGEMFFTKNGVKLKTAFRNVRSVLYPTVGLHSKNECVEVNFGAKPFKFDLQGMIFEERAALQATIDRVALSPGAALSLVSEYLGHWAYGDTLKALQAEAGATAAVIDAADHDGAGHECNGTSSSDQGATGPMATEGDVTWLGLRQRVRLALLRGDVDAALEALRASCPEVLLEGKGYDMLQYQLYCQKFIELVREGHVSAALAWAHTTLSPLRAALPHMEEVLKEVVALLAYDNPQSSPLSHLLGMDQRQAVADCTNTALLGAAAGQPPDAPMQPQSALSRVLRQLVAVHEATLDANGGQGEPLHLPSLLNTQGQQQQQQGRQQQAAMVL